MLRPGRCKPQCSDWVVSAVNQHLPTARLKCLHQLLLGQCSVGYPRAVMYPPGQPPPLQPPPPPPANRRPLAEDAFAGPGPCPRDGPPPRPGALGDPATPPLPSACRPLVNEGGWGRALAGALLWAAFPPPPPPGAELPAPTRPRSGAARRPERLDGVGDVPRREPEVVDRARMSPSSSRSSVKTDRWSLLSKKITKSSNAACREKEWTPWKWCEQMCRTDLTDAADDSVTVTVVARALVREPAMVPVREPARYSSRSIATTSWAGSAGGTASNGWRPPPPLAMRDRPLSEDAAMSPGRTTLPCKAWRARGQSSGYLDQRRRSMILIALIILFVKKERIQMMVCRCTGTSSSALLSLRIPTNTLTSSTTRILGRNLLLSSLHFPISFIPTPRHMAPFPLFPTPRHMAPANSGKHTSSLQLEHVHI